MINRHWIKLLMQASNIKSIDLCKHSQIPDTLYPLYTLSDNSQIVFDNTYSYWMRMLLVLIEHITSERDGRGITIDSMETTPLHQFYGLAENACDQLMYFFAKDQLSGCENNRHLDQLCFQILFGPESEIVFPEPSDEETAEFLDEGIAAIGGIEGAEEKDNLKDFDALRDTRAFLSQSHEIDLAHLRRYMKKLICEEFNAFTVGSFYDFFISFWSGFEATLNKICVPYEAEIQKKLEDSAVKNMKKFLRKLTVGFCEDADDLDKKLLSALDKNRVDLLKDFGPYISTPDKYNYLLKHVIGDKYKRDRNHDVGILEFAGAMRNTVHNNGVHLKADKKVDIDGYEYFLVKNEKRYSEDYADVFLLCQEIVDIYGAIFDGLRDIQKGNV